MLIRHKKTFSLGLFMAASFMGILFYMFTPSFNGETAFHASDRLFNSISKGSTYYIPHMEELNKAFEGEEINVTLEFANEKLASQATTLLTLSGISVTPAAGKLEVSGNLAKLAAAMLADSDAMFKNNGEVLSSKYGMPEKNAQYTWWMVSKATQGALNDQKKFKLSKHLHEVSTKAIEVGYNYYGVQAESAKSKMGILTFALVFYVAYTLWWGYAIFYLSDGIGMQMKGGKKKEV
ncbi:MAG: hypothetical protein AB7E47_07055 [Desulfovibrionaceae bacterium]